MIIIRMLFMRKTGRFRIASQGTRTTRAIAVLSLLATTSAVLYGCSSGGSERDTTTDPEGVETSSSTSGSGSQGPGGTGGTGGTGEPGGAEGGAGGAPNPEGDGGFQSAGRLSGFFPGGWPFAQVVVSNSSDTTTFVGTVTLADCTDAQHRQRATPPQKTVTVLPKATETASFTFTGDSDGITHTVCAQLTDAQGHRQTASNVLGKEQKDGGDSPSAPQKAPGTSSPPQNAPGTSSASQTPPPTGHATSTPKTSGPATSNPKGPTSPAP